MKNQLLTTMLVVFTFLSGCSPDRVDSPELITEPPFPVLISRDSISSGQYLGLGIGDPAEAAYQKTQSLVSLEGISSVNIVGNATSDLSALGARIPLYQYILLDEEKGTDTGVQITFENGQVKFLYLNSGKSLSRWPASGAVALALGDAIGVVHGKLTEIKKNNSFANKFERIMLLTKDLSTPYDPGMSQSPQWYFRYSPQPQQYEEVQIHFENGLVKYLDVRRYKDPV